MSFTDPQSVTISAVPISLPRTSVGNGSSTYLSSDGLVKLTASNSYGKRTRRVIRLDHSKLAADPFRPAENQKVGMSVYTVFDIPITGYVNVDAKAVYDGYKAMLAASSDALITKILGGES